MKKPTISIITPTLNQGAYIQETVNSVLEQRNRNIEYFVIDAGSSDGTPSILKKYRSDLNWLVIPGISQSEAINWGWQQCKGSVLCWLNSDDVLLPGSIDRVLNIFSTNAEIDILYGDCNYIDQNGTFLSVYPTRDFDYKTYLSNAVNYLPQPSTFLRRRVFDSLGGVDENLNYLMDFDYWIRAGLYYQFLHVPQIFSKLRLHSTAKSIRNLKGFAKELTIVYDRFFSRKDLPEDIRALRDRSLRKANYIAANISYWAGEFDSAKRFAYTGWKINPLKPSPLLLFYLLGKHGFPLYKHIRTNPYVKYSQKER